jgi:integrase
MARRSEGIRVRHARSCPASDGGRCRCEPSCEAFVYSAREGKKIRRTFRGKGAEAAAKVWRVDAMVALRRGELHSPTRVTLREAGEDWIGKAERGEVLAKTRRPYKPSTLRGYRRDLAAYVYPDLGALRLSAVSRRDLQALVDRLIGAGYSGSKVRNVIVAVQALYRHARARDEVVMDPTDLLELPEPGGSRERALTPIQAARSLAALPEDEEALWATAFYGGLRRGELRAVRVSDIGQDAIMVERGWDDYEGPIDPKSKAGARAVPLIPTLRDILDAHIERTGRRGDQLLFGRTAYEPFTPSYVQDKADEAWAVAAVGAFLRGERGDVERVTLHECRHTFSTFLDAAGISETRADRYMGHSNPSVARRYRHQLAGQLVEDADRLEAYLAGSASGKVVQIATGAHSGAQEPQTRMAAQAG